MKWMRIVGYPTNLGLDNLLASEWLSMKRHVGQQELHGYSYAAKEFMGLEINRAAKDPVEHVNLHVHQKCVAIALASALLACIALPLLMISQAAWALFLAFVVANATWRIFRWQDRAWKFRQMMGIVDLMTMMRDCEHLADGRPMQLQRFIMAEKLSPRFSVRMGVRVVYYGAINGQFGLIECRADGTLIDQQMHVSGLRMQELLGRLDDGEQSVLGFTSRREVFQLMPDDLLAELDFDCYRLSDLHEFAIKRNRYLLERLPESMHTHSLYEIWIRSHLDCVHGHDEPQEVFAAHPGDVLDKLLGVAAEFELDGELPSVLALRLLERATAWRDEGRLDGYHTLLRWIFWITVGIRYKSPEVADFGRLLATLSRPDSIVNTGGHQLASRECYEQIIAAFTRDMGSDVVAADCHDREARAGFRAVFGHAEALRHFHEHRREFIANDLGL